MRKLTTSEFIERAKLKHGDKYDYNKVEYKNMFVDVVIGCKKHGNFLQTPTNHLQGADCKKCAIELLKSTTSEFIEKAKAKHGNKYDYSKVNYINNTTSITIICPIHGEFLQKPNGHLGGSGCRNCANKLVSLTNTKTTEEFIQEAKAKYGDMFDYSKVVYVGCDSPIKIICNTCHDIFLQRPNDHLHEHGCSFCKNTKRMTTITFIEKAKKVHGDKYDYSLVEYKNNKTAVKIICNQHGVFEQRPDSHLQKHGCKQCNDEKKHLKLEEFIQRAKKTHGDKYDYTNSKYISSKDKIEIICPLHGSFSQFPYVHSKETGCPTCYEERHKLTTEDFIKKCIDTHGDKYDYSETIYQHSKVKIIVICKKHGPFKQFPFGHMFGQGCKKCTSNISNKEIQFLDYLNIPEANRQIRIKKFLVDGFDPVTNTIYEFLGDYWHGNPEIHDRNQINRATKQTFGELYDFTFNYKFKTLKESGYSIKYIWEKDWDSENLVLTIY